MKVKNVLNLVAVASLALAGAGAVTTTASAASVAGQMKDTPATVNITDNDDPTDPLDPTDPQQSHLTLVSVPSNYNFDTSLKNNQYNLDATINEDIKVFNDRSSRDWSVKANVDADKLTKGSSEYDVSSFKVNGTELVGTGANGIVAKSADNKTTANNTGTISTPVTAAQISFTDPNGTLKVGDELNGQVHYQLYNSIDAQ